jgi:hypothetical protein
MAVLMQGVNIQSLINRIAELERRIGISTPHPPLAGRPQIGVTQEGAGQNSIFVVSGSGFLPNKNVTIHATAVTVGGIQQITNNQSSTATGQIAVRWGLAVVHGTVASFSANDGRPDAGDLTGVLWSNTFTLTCN